MLIGQHVLFVGLILSHLPTLAIIVVELRNPQKGGLGYGVTMNQYKWEWRSPSILSRWYNSILSKTLLGGVCKKNMHLPVFRGVFSQKPVLYMIFQTDFAWKDLNEANCPFFCKNSTSTIRATKKKSLSEMFQVHIPVFQICVVFTPKIGEDESILTDIFQMGWNPPTK